MPNLTPISFHETDFDVYSKDGQLWLRSYQIGSALGYTQPDAAISKVLTRNKDEFSKEMTSLIKINGQETRIFSPRGCHLIGMFSRTARAKEFRKWVLDVLDSHNAPAQKQKALPPQPETRNVTEPEKLSSDLSRFGSDSDAFDLELMAYYKSLRARLRMNMRRGKLPRILEKQLQALEKAHVLTVTAIENFAVAAEQTERIIHIKQQLK